MTRSPDDPHMAAAYNQLRRPDWPELHAAVAEPVRGALIRAMAGAIARKQATRRPAPAAAPTTAPASLSPMPAWDAKRAAAGDLDHDHT
jgi:hypothetical protein